MNRILLFLLILIVCSSAPAVGCMNDYKPNVVAITRSQTVLEQLQKHALKEPWEARRDRLRKEPADGGDYRVKNDLATACAHTGQAAEAVALLEQIEAEKPGLYVTAANLGTAYELAGNNEKALEWIRRGIERNARAHEGTEWLHVRILEAKLALFDDPKWLESNSVLGPRKKTANTLGPYWAEIVATGNRGEKLSNEQVKAALIYQLHERFQFVQPPDAIVGSMLLDLGGLIGKEASGLGGAYGVFQLASVYLKGMSNVDSLQQDADWQSRTAERLRRVPSHGNPVLKFAILAITAFVLPSLLVGLKRWLQRRLGGEKAHSAI